MYDEIDAYMKLDASVTHDELVVMVKDALGKPLGDTGLVCVGAFLECDAPVVAGAPNVEAARVEARRVVKESPPTVPGARRLRLNYRKP